MIIAWRIQSIVMLGRAYPDLPCDVVFDDLEWRTAFVIRHHRPPTAPPSYDHYHRFLRRLFGPQVRSASRPQGHLDRTTASAGLCCRANSLRSNQPNLCGMMWVYPLRKLWKSICPSKISLNGTIEPGIRRSPPLKDRCMTTC